MAEDNIQDADITDVVIEESLLLNSKHSDDSEPVDEVKKETLILIKIRTPTGQVNHFCLQSTVAYALIVTILEFYVDNPT